MDDTTGVDCPLCEHTHREYHAPRSKAEQEAYTEGYDAGSARDKFAREDRRQTRRKLELVAVACYCFACGLAVSAGKLGSRD